MAHRIAGLAAGVLTLGWARSQPAAAVFIACGPGDLPRGRRSPALVGRPLVAAGPARAPR